MTFEFFSEMARDTAKYPAIGDSIIYPTLGLAGESGEFADKIKKVFRDKNGIIDDETKFALAYELGDILWYISILSDEIGFGLTTIAEMNIDKLQSRKSRGKLGGSGDDR